MYFNWDLIVLFYTLNQTISTHFHQIAVNRLFLTEFYFLKFTKFGFIFKYMNEWIKGASVSQNRLETDFLLLGWTGRWLIKIIIGFKLFTKGWDIWNTLYVERYTIQDCGSYMAKRLAGKTFNKRTKELVGFLSAVAGWRSLECKMLM